MNVSEIGPLLGAAATLLSGNAGPGSGPTGTASALNDPFAAILQLTHDVDSLATSGLGGLGGFAGLAGPAGGNAGGGTVLASIAGMLA